MKLSARLPQRLRLVLGARLGELAWLALTKRRRVTRTNLAACFPDWPEKRRRALERDHFREVGRGALEMALGFWGTPQKLRRLVRFEGIEHLEKARAAGGTLILVAHVTMIEMIGPLLNLVSEPRPAGVARRQRQPRLNQAVDAARARFLGLALEKKDMRGLLRWVRSGGAALYAPDQDFSFGSVFVPFFGVPAATTTATSRLLGRLNCTLVPGWISRAEDGCYDFEFFPPLAGVDGEDAERDTAAVNAWIEAQVRRRPAQYLWMHRRFRTRPPGEPPFYPRNARRRKHQADPEAVS